MSNLFVTYTLHDRSFHSLWMIPPLGKSAQYSFIMRIQVQHGVSVLLLLHMNLICLYLIAFTIQLY